MNGPEYYKKLIRMQSNDDLYIEEGTVGYKNAFKYLEKNDWQMNGIKYSKDWNYDANGRVIQVERPMRKLEREISLDTLKKGTLEKSCIDNELYLLGDYGFYYNGFGDWFFGRVEKIVTVSREMNYFTFEIEKKEEVRYRVPTVEKLTNQNYKILLEENDEKKF